ncbi:NADH-quinone oxidoreductase subunit NuoE [bacterium]|nr:NADH-quinone oxidoreductase subunit NuoE [bacterium]MBU0899713.1 NADH-quinone oxidoreductase subunit NuoE [bacterium]MBU1154053.1 NADH-quinone oxidoreductase subunit NuoE [bacterium]MBU2599379.1 NADH-quinone oxidoreductase subunit NuoE [bacterium]
MTLCQCREREKEEKFQEILLRYKGQREGLIPILQRVQSLDGYLSKEAMERIADELKILPAEVYGVVTFYTQFKLSPVGKNIINVCHGTACHVGGAREITETIARALEIKKGETTKDLKFTLQNVCCLGCCALAPVLTINDQAYGRLTAEEILPILKTYA